MTITRELTFDEIHARGRELAGQVIDADSLEEAELLITRALYTIYHEGERHGIELLDLDLTNLEAQQRKDVPNG